MVRSILPALVVAYCVACGDGARPVADLVPGLPPQQQRVVRRSDFGLAWPLKVEGGTLACASRSVIFRSDGVNYALNDPARTTGASEAGPIVLMQTSRPPTNPLPTLRQGDRERIFGEAARCATDQCRSRVRERHNISAADLAQIEVEGYERVWPPTPPRKQSLVPLLESGLKLCGT